MWHNGKRPKVLSWMWQETSMVYVEKGMISKKHRTVVRIATHYTTRFTCNNCHDIFMVHQVPKGMSVRKFVIDRGLHCPTCGVAPNIMVQE